MKLEDLSGNRYGMLVVTERAEDKGGRTRWLCKCDCGKTTIAYAINLKRGFTKSCGCNIYKNRGNQNRKKYPQLYNIWKAMRWRCYGESSISYKNYGERGIKLCKEWYDSFDAFCEWSIKNGYKPGLTIDRINNNGIYAPDNCRWTTVKEQARNRRSSIMIEYRGEKKALPEWCDELNLPYDRIHGRWERMRKRGVPIDVEMLFFAGCLSNNPKNHSLQLDRLK